MSLRTLTNPFQNAAALIKSHPKTKRPILSVKRPEKRTQGNFKVQAVQAGEGSFPAKTPTLWQKCLKVYMTSLEERPVFTKALTSFIGFTIGDLVAQHFTAVHYDVWRTIRMSLFGLAVDGPLGHTFYRFIDTNVMPDNPKSTKAVLTKTAIDQLIYAPIGTIIFLTFLTCLEGRPTEVLNVIQSKAIPVLIANYGLWPLVHLLNFRFIPPEQRILFNNSVSILWTTYLSYTCGAGSAGVGSKGSVEMLAASLPCAAHITAAHGEHIATAVRETVAMERLLSSWGKEGLPSSDAGAELVANYLTVKSELLTKTCGMAFEEAKNYVQYK